MPRTKITSKNKNVINIKINTEKKSKNKRRASKHSGSPKGRSGYNMGYAQMPPIIIQPPQQMMFPNYHQQPQINNTAREPQHINAVHEPVVNHIPTTNNTIQQPVNTPEPVKNDFINPVSTTPVAIANTIKRRTARPTEPKPTVFINPPFTSEVSFAKAIEDEKNDLSSPVSLKEKVKPTPVTNPFATDYETDNENIKTNPLYPTLSSVSTKIHPEASSSDDDIVKLKRQEHSDVVNARHHSLVGDFNRKNPEHITKYNNLLEEYNYLKNTDGKPDAEFHGKGASKERYKKLQTRIKKHYAEMEKNINATVRKKPTSKKGQISPEY